MTIDLLWWITAFELPCFAGLFWLIWKGRNDAQHTSDHILSLLDKRTTHLWECLNAHKLEVAKTYVTSAEVKELENRITSHLLRIEAKLDTTALKTEALKNR